MDDQLRRDFLAEAEELIEAVFDDTEALRARRANGRERRALLERIFRHAHTIKGSAAVAEFDAIGEIAHEFENLIEAVRVGRIEASDAAINAFHHAANAIHHSLNQATRGLPPAPAPRALINQLRRLAAAPVAVSLAENSADARSVLDALPDEIARSLTALETHRLREAAQEGARIFLVNASFDIATFQDGFRNLSDALAQDGEIISTQPGVEASAPDQINFRLIYAAVAPHEEIEARVATLGAHVNALGAHDVATDTRAASLDASARRDGASDATDESQTPVVMPEITAGSLSRHVRVPMDKLERLIYATHELASDAAAALDALVSAEDAARPEAGEIKTRAARISRRIFELEEGLIELRMIPVGQTLARAARAAQLAARAEGKDVEIETVGGETRLDKSLADSLSEPLLHLLRNAVAHGIESPDERLRAGKPKRGRIRLEAIAEGNRVRVRVADDGRGIDAERVRRAAVEREIIAPDTTLADNQHLRLIFRPGFSTSATVSNVAGRGVGLDVVERAVEDAGGALRVSSASGSGTTFELVLPTTLALVRSLLVRAGDFRYCLDARHVIEARRLAPDDIAPDARRARWRDTLIPLVSLRELLLLGTLEDKVNSTRPKGASDHRAPSVVISRIAGRDGAEVESVAAVEVDELEGYCETLVRGLGRHATRWRGVTGATEMSDGAIALALNIQSLLRLRLPVE